MQYFHQNKCGYVKISLKVIGFSNTRREKCLPDRCSVSYRPYIAIEYPAVSKCPTDYQILQQRQSVAVCPLYSPCYHPWIIHRGSDFTFSRSFGLQPVFGRYISSLMPSPNSLSVVEFDKRKSSRIYVLHYDSLKLKYPSIFVQSFLPCIYKYSLRLR